MVLAVLQVCAPSDGLLPTVHHPSQQGGLCRRLPGKKLSGLANIREKFFTVRVMKHWIWFPKEVVDVQSMEEVFKAGLAEALSNLI